MKTKQDLFCQNLLSYILASVMWDTQNAEIVSHGSKYCLYKLLYEGWLWTHASAQYLSEKKYLLKGIFLFVQERMRMRSWMRWCMKPGDSTETVNCWETACRGSAGTVSTISSCLYQADPFVLLYVTIEKQSRHLGKKPFEITCSCQFS